MIVVKGSRNGRTIEMWDFVYFAMRNWQNWFEEKRRFEHGQD